MRHIVGLSAFGIMSLSTTAWACAAGTGSFDWVFLVFGIAALIVGAVGAGYSAVVLFPFRHRLSWSRSGSISVLGGPVAIAILCGLMGLDVLQDTRFALIAVLAAIPQTAYTLGFYLLLRKKNDKRRRSAA